MVMIGRYLEAGESFAGHRQMTAKVILGAIARGPADLRGVLSSTRCRDDTDQSGSVCSLSEVRTIQFQDDRKTGILSCQSSGRGARERGSSGRPHGDRGDPGADYSRSWDLAPKAAERTSEIASSRAIELKQGQAVNWDDIIIDAAATDTGMRRANNQDSFTAVRASHAAAWRQRGHVFMVADGMGAHAVGELASKMACDLIPHTYLKMRARHAV